MVAHKDIGMHLNWIEIYTLGKNLQKFTPVIIALKISLFSFPRHVTWYQAPEYSVRRDLAIQRAYQIQFD